MTTLSAGLGRLLSQDEENKCFPCHTSEGVLDGKLQPDRMKPGVTCENCHGPGSQHIDAINNRDWKHLHIFNPGRLRMGEVNDFCGTCHRSTREVAVAGIFGIRNVRFQPYRLEGSRCYDANDKRITCLACHDPHVQLVTDIQSYDSKCLACHVLRGQVGQHPKPPRLALVPTRAVRPATCKTHAAGGTSQICRSPDPHLPGCGKVPRLSHVVFSERLRPRTLAEAKSAWKPG